MIKVLFSIFPTTCPWLIVWNFFIAKLIALPTANRKEGKTRSVGVNPCQAECCNWEKERVSLPGVLTMIIKQTVIPLKMSSASDREDGAVICLL